MPDLDKAVERYHSLLEASMADPGWAEALQAAMRQHHLTEAGRLIAPILRPHFITRHQLESLTRISEHLSGLIHRLESLVRQSPALMQRLGMLPAEKVFATAPSGYPPRTVTSRLDAQIHNGSLAIGGLDTWRSSAFVHSEIMADLFLDLPIFKEFKKGGCKVSKLDGPKFLHSALLQAWKDFGGIGRPNIAIVDCQQNRPASESESFATLFQRFKSPARLVALHTLEYDGKHLRQGDFRIDVVFRRVLARQLLLLSDLSHPLIRAYRAGKVCIVNSLGSEIAVRRSLFELLTDESITAGFSAPDRDLIRSSVPWTRILTNRKTKYRGQNVDLPEFLLRNRERFVLVPNEDSGLSPSFVGAELSARAWASAVQTALRDSYIAQERTLCPAEDFPLFSCGEMKMKPVRATVHPHIFDGQMHGASATLYSASGSAPLAVAPVLLVE